MIMTDQNFLDSLHSVQQNSVVLSSEHMVFLNVTFDLAVITCYLHIHCLRATYFYVDETV